MMQDSSQSESNVMPCCEDCSKDYPNWCDCLHCAGPEAVGFHSYTPVYDSDGNEMVSEDYLAEFLPDGWRYDCWVGDPEWHFTIYMPNDPEPYHLAFQSITEDGFCVWAD